jgi:hypothetical protein
MKYNAMIVVAKNRKYKNIRGGFTILYAILIATVVLTIGLSLLEVLTQQVSLSGAQRESGLSFYTADSGLECALYWDISGDAFRVGSSITCDGNSPLPPGIITSGGLISPPPPPSDPFVNEEIYTFSVTFPQGCASLYVRKTVDPLTNNVSTTTMESRGYNTICPPAASAKPWRLERGLRTIY